MAAPFAATPSSSTIPNSMDIILVGYSKDRTARALLHCDRTFGRLSVRRRILVLNNKEQPEPVAASGWEVVRGSNSLGEFSGWHEGLAILAPTSSDAVLFVNDTVGAYRHLSTCRRWALLKEIRNADPNCLIGFAGDSQSQATGLSISGMWMERWVSSYCFLLTGDALRKLGGRLFDPDEVASCVPGGTRRQSFFSEQVSPALRKHLVWWLFEGWHRSEALTPESHVRLGFKARCICAELLLSARCRKLGIELRDPFIRHPAARFLDIVSRQCWKLLGHVRPAR